MGQGKYPIAVRLWGSTWELLKDGSLKKKHSVALNAPCCTVNGIYIFVTFCYDNYSML